MLRLRSFPKTPRSLGRHSYAVALTSLLTLPSRSACADENGVSFWLPGLSGSLAAVPQTPGWSLGSVYYHTTVGASGSVAAAREITIGHLPANVAVSFNASLNKVARRRADPRSFAERADFRC